MVGLVVDVMLVAKVVGVAIDTGVDDVAVAADVAKESDIDVIIRPALMVEMLERCL